MDRHYSTLLLLPKRRFLTAMPEGWLSQMPVPELANLRNDYFLISDISLANTSYLVGNVEGNALEIIVEFELGNARSFGMKLCSSDNAGSYVKIGYDGLWLDVAGEKAPFKLIDGEETYKLHVFLDKSVIKVYANDRVCFTNIVYTGTGEKNIRVEVFSYGGDTKVKSVYLWRMNPIRETFCIVNDAVSFRKKQ
jgi:sucrose-6-phosphate hydrolase SacC (GH32 family)